MLTAVILAEKSSEISSDFLSSLNWCTEIIIVLDSLSFPLTKSQMDPRVKWYSHPLNGDYSQKRNFGLRMAKYEWVLFIDTDETVTPQLAAQIQKVTTTAAYSGYYLIRQDIVWNKILRFGDSGNYRILRLGQKSKGLWKGRVHETWEISKPISVLSCPLYHRPFTNLSDFLVKLNKYSDIRANYLHSTNHKAGTLHIIFYPISKFIYLWLFRLGFLDGIEGLIHALSMAFYSFLVRSKLYFLSH